MFLSLTNSPQSGIADHSERLQDARFELTPESRYALEEWAEALEGFFRNISYDKWVNHPNSNALASHSLEQLSRASNMGFAFPRPYSPKIPTHYGLFTSGTTNV